MEERKMTGKFRIYVAGHRGMVGQALVSILEKQESGEIITRNRDDLNLLDQRSVESFFAQEKIDEVYLAAAKVGGIMANNTYPAEFLYENLMIQANVINSAFKFGIRKLLFLGSSCIYPKNAPQPMVESSLLSSQLEPTNEPYAIAKIAGIKLCESYNRQFGQKFGVDYRSVMPTNLYGPGDNYHPENSHVIPGLIRRFHEAKINKTESVTIWGSGEPRREFLYVEDMATACLHVMNLSREKYLKLTSPMVSHINVGSGSDMTIKELANLIKNTVGYTGKIVFDRSKPDGTPQKLLDSSLLNSWGWHPKIPIDIGLTKTYNCFLNSEILSNKAKK